MSCLLSDEASKELVKGIIKIAEKMANEKVKQMQKRWINQREVRETFRCTHKDVITWEKLGLKKRKQGKSLYYDRFEIEDLLQKLKN
ncbi:DNA-binding protein [Staphylococcus pasteuri]|uniref:DNA-binding protein n=1 Tax=Staphylococcus pasteuri TaxID=45972 RepID=UPI001E6125AF|nr:DNA-binding protein [Staphylococcus pasteuri]MCE3022729.1 DNA-binding protein [Staphylococcus pasteuri]